LPPNINQAAALEDVRGYDGVDPGNFVRLFELAIDQKRTPFLFYARTQLAFPAVRQTRQGLKLHPVANLLNVRYLVLRERPGAGFPVVAHEDDFWILENRDALPRAYVPRSLSIVKSDKQALAEMASSAFEPLQTAFITDDLRLPDQIRGTASVHDQSPTRAEIDVDMQTNGLVLLSDLWDAGWRAELDDVACPIYRVDLALRGFQVPAGKHRIVCVYDPRSVRIGFFSATAGGVILLLWLLWTVRADLRARSLRPAREAPT
jgi:hypothetical protein